MFVIVAQNESHAVFTIVKAFDVGSHIYLTMFFFNHTSQSNIYKITFIVLWF